MLVHFNRVDEQSYEYNRVDEQSDEYNRVDEQSDEYNRVDEQSDEYIEFWQKCGKYLTMVLLAKCSGHAWSTRSLFLFLSSSTKSTWRFAPTWNYHLTTHLSYLKWQASWMSCKEFCDESFMFTAVYLTCKHTNTAL